jgi:molybdenum cofactor sulfurtransferase
MNNIDDIHGFVHFLQEHFSSWEICSYNPSIPQHLLSPKHTTLNSIFIFPIKSCAAVLLTQPWTLGKNGLLLDRKWLIIDERSGTILTQKRYPKMALIRPQIDLVKGFMQLKAHGFIQCNAISLWNRSTASDSAQTIHLQLCGRQVKVVLDANHSDIDKWLSSFLNIQVRLCYLEPPHIQHNISSSRNENSEQGVSKSASNESPYLIVNESSFKYIRDRVQDTKWGDIMSFRPNFIIGDNLEPFEEDLWESVDIGNQRFNVRKELFGMIINQIPF